MRRNQRYLFLLAFGCYSNVAFSDAPVAPDGWQSSNKKVLPDAGLTDYSNTGLGENAFNFRTDGPLSSGRTKEFKRDAEGRYLEHDVDRVSVGQHLNIKVEKPSVPRVNERKNKRLDAIGDLDAPKVGAPRIGLEIKR